MALLYNRQASHPKNIAILLIVPSKRKWDKFQLDGLIELNCRLHPSSDLWLSSQLRNLTTLSQCKELPWFLKPHSIILPTYCAVSGPISKLDEKTHRCCTEASVHIKENNWWISILWLPANKKCNLWNREIDVQL